MDINPLLEQGGGGSSTDGLTLWHKIQLVHTTAADLYIHMQVRISNTCLEIGNYVFTGLKLMLVVC